MKWLSSFFRGGRRSAPLEPRPTPCTHEEFEAHFVHGLTSNLYRCKSCGCWSGQSKDSRWEKRYIYFVDMGVSQDVATAQIIAEMTKDAQDKRNRSQEILQAILDSEKGD